jgi:hypothetical protein
MCWDILKEAKRVRHILATDPDGPETRQYLLEGNCEWLLNDTNEFWKAIGLMDIFIEWLEMQLEANVDMGWSFFINITGP